MSLEHIMLNNVSQAEKDTTWYHFCLESKTSNKLVNIEYSFFFFKHYSYKRASQVVLLVKNLLANAGDIRNADLIPGSGKSPGGGHGNPLQYSCLENPMDRGAWSQRVRHDWSDLACIVIRDKERRNREVEKAMWQRRQRLELCCFTSQEVP